MGKITKYQIEINIYDDTESRYVGSRKKIINLNEDIDKHTKQFLDEVKGRVLIEMPRHRYIYNVIKLPVVTCCGKDVVCREDYNFCSKCGTTYDYNGEFYKV